MGSAGGPPSAGFKSRNAARVGLSSLFCTEQRMEPLPAVLSGHMAPAGHWQKPQQAGVVANKPHGLLSPLTLFALSLGIMRNVWSSGMTNSAVLCVPAHTALLSPAFLLSSSSPSFSPLSHLMPLLRQKNSFRDSSAL